METPSSCRYCRPSALCVLGKWWTIKLSLPWAGLGALVDVGGHLAKSIAGIAETTVHANLGCLFEFVQADVTDLSTFGRRLILMRSTRVGHVCRLGRRTFGNTTPSRATQLLVPERTFQWSANTILFRRIWKRVEDDALGEVHVILTEGHLSTATPDDVLSRASGSLKSYEHHWTVAGLPQFRDRRGVPPYLPVDEFGEHVGDWEGAPLTGLPEFLLIVARKDEIPGIEWADIQLGGALLIEQVLVYRSARPLSVRPSH